MNVLAHADRNPRFICPIPIGTPFLLNINPHQGATKTIVRSFMSLYLSAMTMNPYVLQ